MCDDDSLVRFGQVPQDVPAVAIPNQRAGWNTNDKISAASAVAIVPKAGPAFLRPPVFPVGNVCQIVFPGDSFDDDVTAISTVPTVRSASRDILFAAEAAAAAAAIAAFHI
jgi:hypothetical protein